MTYERPDPGNFGNVPGDLGEFDSWIVWREGPPCTGRAKPSKIPVNPLTLQNASTADSATWSSRETALESFQKHKNLAGVGFVFSEDDPFSGLDLDNCRDPETGALEPWAAELVRYVDSYAEVSPSRKGIKIIVKAKLAGKRNHFEFQGHEVEVYDRGRYFAVTGERLENAPAVIYDRQKALDSLLPDQPPPPTAAASRLRSEDPAAKAIDAISDEELVRRIKCSAQGEKFSALMEGSTAGYAGYFAASGALCAMLAAWTRCDPERIDRIYRTSGLYEESWWDDRCYSGRRSRAEVTIAESCALAANGWLYDPTPRPNGQRTPQARPERIDPWSLAAGMDTFLESEEEGIDFLFEPVVAKEAVTEIFSPRGLGKSLWALFVAVLLARAGRKVLLIDRDNPRRVVRERLRAFGATRDLSTLKILPRENAPPLTNARAWAEFPYTDYDLVIVDSFDSAAEGVGEQDSTKPSQAIASLLDVARRENGPAVLVLGNTIKTAAHSRGSGVIEDRADVVFEVRDATNLHPTGKKPWIEELPAADAGSWAGRSTRRKRLSKYRLAFIATKFRIGEEPEPFVMEIDLTVEPWTVRDVTDLVDREGAESRARGTREKAQVTADAANALTAEIQRRHAAGEEPFQKEQAVAFLQRHQLTRKGARELITVSDQPWRLAKIGGHGSPVAVLPAGWHFDPVSGAYERDGGEKPVLRETAPIAGSSGPSFRHPQPEHPAERSQLEDTDITELTGTPLITAAGFEASPDDGESGAKDKDDDEIAL